MNIVYRINFKVTNRFSGEKKLCGNKNKVIGKKIINKIHSN